MFFSSTLDVGVVLTTLCYSFISNIVNISQIYIYIQIMYIIGSKNAKSRISIYARRWLNLTEKG